MREKSLCSEESKSNCSIEEIKEEKSSEEEKKGSSSNKSKPFTAASGGSGDDLSYQESSTSII